MNSLVLLGLGIVDCGMNSLVLLGLGFQSEALALKEDEFVFVFVVVQGDVIELVVFAVPLLLVPPMPELDLALPLPQTEEELLALTLGAELLGLLLLFIKSLAAGEAEAEVGSKPCPGFHSLACVDSFPSESTIPSIASIVNYRLNNCK